MKISASAPYCSSRVAVLVAAALVAGCPTGEEGSSKPDAAGPEDTTPPKDGLDPLDADGANDAQDDVQVAQPDGAGRWVWDDSFLDRTCESIWDECGQGNICLADVSCFPDPDTGWSCTSDHREAPGFYHCQRKCRSDAHCEDIESRCVCLAVGNGESELELFFSVCLPDEPGWAFPLERCRIEQQRMFGIEWPPLP